MKRRLIDVPLLALLFLLPLILFWSQTVGGRTLLPTENLFADLPFSTYRAELNVPEPHNGLLADLVLENLQWKTFTLDSLRAGEIPLWNPHQFSGIPFMASGQQSTLYPLSLLYYVLPLPAAYGWFTVVNLGLAGALMFGFLRGLGVRRIGALVGGVVYELSAFFVISAVFPMIIGAAAWLPLVLWMVEWIIQRRVALRGTPTVIPWVAIGAVALGCNLLAGHVEITYYTLLIAGYYAAGRLLVERLAGRLNWREVVTRGLALLVMVGLGIGLGAVQFIPLFELVSKNFRSGSASFQQVLDWAHPMRDVVQFFIPNFYGSPAHHVYFDVFNNRWTAAPGVIDWGMKNYVESALYLGLLPLALAGVSIAAAVRRGTRRSTVIILAILALASLTFMFGLPTYGLLFYTLPGIDQLHSPFRWVFALTVCVSVLAGFGADVLASSRADAENEESTSRWIKRTGWALISLGGLILVGLVLSRLLYPQLEPMIERARTSLALADRAFPDAAMFYSYEAYNVLLFGLFTLSAGIVLRVSRCPIYLPGFLGRRPVWEVLAVGVIALDLMAASWGFNPASDPALLDFTPPSIVWLQENADGWRYTTLDSPTRPRVLNANNGMRYGLDDIRGYESIIPKTYVDFIGLLAPQYQLEYNRVAPLFTEPDFNHPGGIQAALESDLIDLLNVRYLMTYPDQTLDAAGWSQAYVDEAVSIWENDQALPRAWLVPAEGFDPEALTVPAEVSPVTITADTGRELTFDVTVAADSWLVVSQNNFPGWRAYMRPAGEPNSDETALTIETVKGIFPAVRLTEPGTYALRLVYSPQSFQVGGFGSFIAGIVLLLALGFWLWGIFVGAPKDTSAAGRVARNSIAPILLNLFNRAIDFAFAAVMLRVLGPEGSGIYYYAAIVFGWFEIFTNFGLNLYLTREVSRDRSAARRFLFNTSALRLLLIVVGIPLLVGFLRARDATVAEPLTAEALIAIGLLYIGLIPGSLNTGLSALYYAFERAEIPAAIATVATISKTVLGLGALLAGWGVVGLAAVSIITNLVTLGVLTMNARGMFRGDARPDPTLMRQMAGQSWPLMLNHFLANIFFQIDVILIEAIHGAVMVAQYSVAYKWVLAINIIPSFFTQAMLPIMSRQAHEDRAALKRNYVLSLKLLLLLALPTAVAFTFLAEPLTLVLGGAEYLPDGAIALQLMIWSIPIGWMNSLTQYVLVALDLQRRITGAFALGVGFNIIANLLLIPTYGYRAAALITIASELMLLVPFALLLKSAIGAIPWGEIVWKPALGAAAMFAVCALLWPVLPIAAVGIGAAVYAGVLIVLHPFSDEERARLGPLLPGPLRRWA